MAGPTGTGRQLTLEEWRKEPGKYEVKLNGAYEFVHFKFKDFTDLRTGDKYAYSASILQLYVTGTF